MFELKDIKFAWEANFKMFNKDSVYNYRKIIGEYSIERIKRTKDELVILRSKKRIIFVYAPTNDLNDWLSNIKISKKITNNNYQIHTGFRQGAFKFSKDIEHIIKNSNGKKISFTGFSRGAALATESSRFCTEILKKPCECIVFAVPGVGSNNYAETMSKNKLLEYCSIFHQKDIVHTILEKIGYCHIKKQEVILPKKWWHYLPFMKKKIHLSTSDIMKINTILIKRYNN